MYTYCKIDDYFFIYDVDNDRFIKRSTNKSMTKYKNRYELLIKKYIGFKKDINIQSIKKGLRQYAEDLPDMMKELKSSCLTIDYMKYYTDGSAVLMTAKRLSPLLNDALKNNTIESVDVTEYKWIDACHNGGLVTFDESYKDKEVDVYCHDFESYYAYCMTKFSFPVKRGKECILDEPKGFGYFRLNITYKSKEVKKRFAFSKKNVYTNYSIWSLRELQKTYTDLEFSLAQDGEPNAYVYNDKHLVNGQKVFGNWFDKLITIKREHAKNLLAKGLLSKLHGKLTSPNKEFITMELGESYDRGGYILDLEFTRDGKKKYTIIRDHENAYMYGGIGRIQPFLSSYCRRDMTSNIIKYSNQGANLIKVETDGMFFDKDISIHGRQKRLKKDEKFTGKFIIKGSDKNRWVKVTS